MKRSAKKSPSGKKAKPVAKARGKTPTKKVFKLAKSLIKNVKKSLTPSARQEPKKKVVEKTSRKSLSSAQKKAEIIKELMQAPEPEVILTNADGKQYCKVHDCDNEATTEGHCRLHYIASWKRNKIKAKILAGGKLDKYIEDLTNKYPDKYLEMLRKDLASEKDFNLIVAEMDLEDAGEDSESEDEASRFIEEVRGGVPTSDDDEGGF